MKLVRREVYIDKFSVFEFNGKSLKENFFKLKKDFEILKVLNL